MKEVLKIPLQLRKATKARCVSGCHWIETKRPLCEALKILDCLGVLRMLTFLTFGAVMSILCHCMLEVCDLFFHFDFTGVTTKKFLEDSEDTLVLDFKTCLWLLKTMGIFKVGLNEFCVMIWQQAFGRQEVVCGDLNKNGLHRNWSYWRKYGFVGGCVSLCGVVWAFRS